MNSIKYIAIVSICFLFAFCQKKNSATCKENSQEYDTLPISIDSTKVIPMPTVGIQVGDIAPDLNLQDTSGVFITLSSLRGKIVLVDFWASWCAPCKNENKKLVNVYKHYKDTSFKNSSGFEIFMASVFEYKKEHWVSELRKQKYNWKFNVYDEGGAATYLYDIKAIPKNFLLDEKGVILARDLRDTLVEKALIQLLK